MTCLTALVNVLVRKLLTLLGHFEYLLVKLIIMHKPNKCSQDRREIKKQLLNVFGQRKQTSAEVEQLQLQLRSCLKLNKELSDRVRQSSDEDLYRMV